MAKSKKVYCTISTRKFAQVKRMLNPSDMRLKENQVKEAKKEEDKKAQLVKHVAPVPTSLFLSHNESLAPPYRILVDTNFINLSLENRIEMITGMMDTLFAKCIPCVSDCVMAELEKLGPKYRLALRVARDERFERLPCSHKGTYADDCIIQRITAHRCYLVATNDRALRRRIRKIPGVPIMYISKRRYAVEKLPESI